MIRPKPTKELIIEICSGKTGGQRFIEHVHHGLIETPLSDLYPVLDLDELIAFEAGSWQLRNNNGLRINTQTSDVYDIFSHIFNSGFPYMNKNKEISEKMKDKHNKLNPFRGRDLRPRLETINQDSISNLRKSLQEETNTYVFECQYHDTKRARGGDNYKLEIMRFQNVYPKRGTIIPAYATEISRIVSQYPKEILVPEATVF